jgi:hypothetical protein
MPSAALERHPASPCAALRGIEAAVTRTADGSLQLAYRLEGDLDRVRIAQARAPRIAERLWQHTCCELFIASAAGGAYHEFNFSPSGEWAAYRFERYRHGMAVLETLAEPRIRVQRAAGVLELHARISLPLPSHPLLGLSAVIEETDGTLSYWALRHAPGKPDFHHRHAFALELDEVRH